jgi:Ala-tRNA(Pro) deacylase
MDDAPLPTPPEKLFALFAELDIPYQLYHHDPFFTVADGEHLKKDIPGLHCRNLFLRDKKERMFLITAGNDTRIDLKKLEFLLDCGRLSFGSPERLWQYLGVRPGHVCPFAAVNDKDNKVISIIDKAMMDAGTVAVHPMENHMTICLKPADLLKFLEFHEHTAHITDLKQAAPEG